MFSVLFLPKRKKIAPKRLPLSVKEAGWPDDQPSLETVKSVDELLELLYPEYGLFQQCLRRKAHRGALSSSYPSFPDASASPLVPHADDEEVWAPLRKGAVFTNGGPLESKSHHGNRVFPRPLSVKRQNHLPFL